MRAKVDAVPATGGPGSRAHTTALLLRSLYLVKASYKTRPALRNGEAGSASGWERRSHGHISSTPRLQKVLRRPAFSSGRQERGESVKRLSRASAQLEGNRGPAPHPGRGCTAASELAEGLRCRINGRLPRKPWPGSSILRFGHMSKFSVES